MSVPPFDITKPMDLTNTAALAVKVLEAYALEGAPFTKGDATRVVRAIDKLHANLSWPSDAQMYLGQTVRKKGRASWRGKIVGWYRTDLTALGYVVESIFEPGSAQIYPETALEAWEREEHIPRVERIAKSTREFFEKGVPDVPKETLERIAALAADLMAAELTGETMAAKHASPKVRQDTHG